MAINIAQIRKDTPAVAISTHLNNAGAALMPQPVVRAMSAYLDIETQLGGYESAAFLAEPIARFYDYTAELLQAAPAQIAYTSSATDSFNRALSSVPFERGEVLLTTPFDYVSNQIAFLQLAKRQGVRVIRAAATSHGLVDVDDMRRLIDQHRPRLVAVTHVPTNQGIVQDIAAIGAHCRERDVCYLVDACQSAGQLPLDVKAIGCDFLSGTWRKFLRGPRGAGFLYVSERVLQRDWEPLFLDLHSARWTEADQYQAVEGAKRFELWERNFSSVLGAAAAARYALDQHLDAISARILRLTELLRTKLEEIEGVRVQERGPIRCGILTFSVEDMEAVDFQQLLRNRRVHGSIVYGSYDPINLKSKEIEWTYRFSPHYYNTESDIERAAVIVQHTLREHRK